MLRYMRWNGMQDKKKEAESKERHFQTPLRNAYTVEELVIFFGSVDILR